MAPDIRRSVSFGKTVAAGFQQKNVTFMAASIAYQAFISLLPLLVLVFFLVTIVGGDQFATEVTAATEGFLPDSGQLIIENAIEDSPASAGSSIIGLVVLLWGALKIFRGLDTAFSEIYETTAESSLIDQLRDGLIVFGALGGALLAAVAASIVLAFFPTIPFISVLQPLLLVGVLTVAFLPMYYYFPDADVTAREVLPGAAVAAVGWTALQSLFQVYVSFAGSSESAGPLGAILLLLTWLYFGGLILLLGGVVNAVSAGRLEPEADADEDTDETDAVDEFETIPESKRPPMIDDVQREREHLTGQLETVVRERDQLQHDLAAQRSRRYRLEDRVDELESRVDTLEATNRDLESENERLRRELEEERRQEPEWKRRLRGGLARVRTLRIGVIERE
ncbi:YhjD/YihY/BrkB family envelope integrity protein [Halopiger aswanensis]|uniref:Membrane protein n=1 Tax=Halopiger aswanensis TaxID=148449 RepID=A0A3R7EGM9_9EURY|nr:YhjD/YihY/BrkB family envelope integrity protein [Halopiger aswanensis]RKD97192.1 membrane protein [Halopiger aswanensis]